MSDELTAVQNPANNAERNVVFEEALEAMLFAAGHPLTYATIARVLEMTPGKVRSLTYDYAEKYNKSDLPRGVMLLAYPDSCQLCTKEYYLPEIRNALGIRKSGSLSTSSMEALAIIAYNQPVTRLFVDTLRRADSSYAMTNLLDRGLIESTGRLDVPGRPMLYGTTTDFLRCFGFKDLSELPQATEDLVNMFAKASNAPEDDTAVEGGEQLDLDEAIAAADPSANPETVEKPGETFEELDENADDTAMMDDDGTVPDESSESEPGIESPESEPEIESSEGETEN